MHIVRNRPASHASLRFAVLIVSTMLVVGCSGSDPNVGQVEGVVRLNGHPVPSGKVLFQPAAGRGSTGVIQSDGTFSLGSEGAVIGQHKVAIVAFEPGKVTGQSPGGPRAPLKAIVPERYLAAGTSGLMCEVKPGDNHAEFELTSP